MNHASLESAFFPKIEESQTVENENRQHEQDSESEFFNLTKLQ